MSFRTTIPTPAPSPDPLSDHGRPGPGRRRAPNVRLQRALSRPGRVTALDRVLSIVHWVWFFEPHLSLLFVQARHVDRFPRAARQMAATYDLGCAIYYAVPTAPPWWASEQGYMRPPVEQIPAEVAADAAERAPAEVRRIMVDVGEGVWGRAWDRMYDPREATRGPQCRRSTSRPR